MVLPPCTIRPGEADQIDAEMVVKAPVFRCQNRLRQRRRQIGQAHGNAVQIADGGDFLAVLCQYPDRRTPRRGKTVLDVGQIGIEPAGDEQGGDQPPDHDRAKPLADAPP
jgi:hypothetical protein